MLPSTFLGLALFVAFIAPGAMWVRVEERYRPRPNRSQLLEAADLLTFGAVASVLSFSIVATLGELRLPFLRVSSWLTAPDPSAYLETNVVSATVSLATTVILANGGARFAAQWRFRRGGGPRIKTAHTVWYDTLGSLDEQRQAAVLTIAQEDGSLVTGVLRSYHVSAMGNDQDIALQAPITRETPGQKPQTVPPTSSYCQHEHSVRYTSLHVTVLARGEFVTIQLRQLPASNRSAPVNSLGDPSGPCQPSHRQNRGHSLRQRLENGRPVFSGYPKVAVGYPEIPVLRFGDYRT